MTQKLVIENFQKEYLIYKIECNMTGKIYIGHTSNLTSRINTHISSFKKGILSCSSCKILTHNDYKISVLRRNIYDKDEASKCELDFINGYGSMSVNKNKPCVGISKKEYQRQYQKKYKLKMQDLREEVSSLLIDQQFDESDSDDESTISCFSEYEDEK